MSQFKVASVSEIPEGQVKVVYAGDTRLAVGCVEGKYYSIEDLCSHDGGPLGEGMLCGYEIECPRHGALFDIRNGAALTMPAVIGVQAFSASSDGESVFVEVSED